MRTRFREAMIEHLDRAGMTSAELARRSGVPKTLIDKLRQRKSEVTNVHDAMRIAQVFGRTVEEMCGVEPDPETSAIADLLSRLDPAEKSLVLSQLEGIAARKRRR